MTESFTEDQEVVIQKRIAEAQKMAAIIEDWRNAEDTLKRTLILLTKQNIASGLWHPFLEKVAETMKAAPLSRIDEQSESLSQPNATPEKEPVKE